ncbi:MAG: endonuclease III [Bacteroidales bacterium]|nr:endonuclease III [Bacteroidales bacterium]
MTRQEKYRQVIDWFSATMPDAGTELQFQNPFQLLVAVILSAQCTDKRVNIVTPALFEAFPTPEVMAASEPQAVYPYIRSVSYPNAKARHLVEMARVLTERYGGQVPQTMEELLSLPGVGRKTASVMLICAFDKPAMPVDTHVFRVSNRIGLTRNSKSPEETEKILMANFPEELLPLAHHWLILHGRYVCQARRPLCGQCGLSGCCDYFKQGK